MKKTQKCLITELELSIIDFCKGPKAPSNATLTSLINCHTKWHIHWFSLISLGRV